MSWKMNVLDIRHNLERLHSRYHAGRANELRRNPTQEEVREIIRECSWIEDAICALKRVTDGES